MKLHLAVLALLASQAHGFCPTNAGRPASMLSMSVDSSEAVKAAMEASEKFGKTSTEARVAWELVEEIDAANSHEKQEKVSKKTAVAVAEPDEQPAKEPVVHLDTSEAIKNALEASKIYGKTSKEAMLAWDLVEELDGANSHHRPSDIHVKKEEPVAAVAEPEEPSKPVKPLPTTVEEAIEAATLASKLYGKKSVESRMAWELVEEMDAASSHIRASKEQAEKEAAPAPAVVEKKPTRPILHKDASEAIKAALAASKEFGKTSVEARMAWELVEEIDATNAHHKTVGSG